MQQQLGSQRSLWQESLLPHLHWRRRQIAKPHKRKTRAGSSQTNSSLFAQVPTSWFPDSSSTEFSSRNNIPLTGRRPFPYPFQQHSGCLLSLHHAFHSIISTFLFFREICNKCKATSARTTAHVSLRELTTVNLRECTQSEDLRSFKKYI